MFSPNNGKSLIVAGNLLVLLFNVLQIRSLKKQAAGMTGSGTPGGKVLFKKEDAYGSAFIAIVFIFIGTAMHLLEGLSAGEPTMDIDCSDPMTLLRTVLRVGILIPPTFAVAISFPGEFFVNFEERIEWSGIGSAPI